MILRMTAWINGPLKLASGPKVRILTTKAQKGQKMILRMPSLMSGTLKLISRPRRRPVSFK